MVKVIYDRDKCIGAAACIAEDSDDWSMNDDGKADLKGAVNNESTGKQELEITDPKQIEKMKAAADVCPVKVIVVEE